MSTVEQKPVKVEFTITFPNEQYASIVAQTIAVDDADIKEGRITRHITHNGADLTAVVTGTDPKVVRVVVGSLLENVNLTTKTMAVFSPPTDYVVPHNASVGLPQ